MKKAWMLLLALVAALGFSGPANAALSTIGTATYLGKSYNLIYEDDQKLVWLDYTSADNSWQEQVDWAATLNDAGVLTYNLNPGVTLKGNWRLPATVDGKLSFGYDGTTTAGQNITTSEMGHLYYVSLGNLGSHDTSGNEQSGWGLRNKGPFNILKDTDYWSGTECSFIYPGHGYAWWFFFYDGSQDRENIYNNINALAVRPGEVVSAVPVPASVFLLASGLLGLVGFRRKFRK